MFVEHFGHKKVSEITDADLLQFARVRRADNEVVTTTNNRYFSRLRAMYKHLKKRNPALNAPEFPINIHAERERHRVVSIDEEKRILAACVDKEIIEIERKGKTYTAKIHAKRAHVRPVIIIALDTALRLGEIMKLVWKDIDMEKGLITVRAENSKTQKSRQIGMTARVRTELELLKKAAKGENVFNFKTPEKSFDTACVRAKVKDLRFHDLRHSAVTRMIRAGIPAVEVMKISGHTQMKTFLRYLNLTAPTVQSAADKLSEFLSQQT